MFMAWPLKDQHVVITVIKAKAGIIPEHSISWPRTSARQQAKRCSRLKGLYAQV